MLGQHLGITHYTIGQRKGLNLAMGRPVFVVEIRPDTNEVVIGEGEDVFTDRCLLYTSILMDQSAIARLNVEMCYPYCAQFKRSVGVGGVQSLGEGAFRIEKPLYDYEVMKPGQYYYPQEVSEELLEELLVRQMEGARRSVEYAKRLVREYEEEQDRMRMENGF